MYPVSPSTSSFSRTARYWTSPSHWLWGPSIHSKMNTGDWGWDTQDQLSAGGTMGPVICASDMTHLTNVRAISMPGCCILWLVIFERISAGHMKSEPGLSSAWSHVHQKVPKTLTRHGIPRLELCCPDLGSLTSPAPAWNWIMEMDSSHNVTIFWLPGSGIIWNKSWLLKTHMAHARCGKFLKLRRWGTPLFDHWRTHESSICTRSCSWTVRLMLCTL